MEKYIPELLPIIFKNGLHLEPSFKR
jgi:hypothetical protein